jgi:hypothetical protein
VHCEFGTDRVVVTVCVLVEVEEAVTICGGLVIVTTLVTSCGVTVMVEIVAGGVEVSVTVIAGSVAIIVCTLIEGDGVAVWQIGEAVFTAVVTRVKPGAVVVVVFGRTYFEQACETTSQTKFVTLGGRPLIVQAAFVAGFEDLVVLVDARTIPRLAATGVVVVTKVLYIWSALMFV